MKSRIYVSWVLFLICCVSLILISCGDSTTTVAKPKDPPKPKPKPEVKEEIELIGKVEKMVVEKDKPVIYHLKNLENKLVVLSNKVGDKEVDLEQFVGKEVAVKCKAEITLKTSVSGEEYKSVRLIRMHSIELKVEGAEKTEKPAETITEKPKEKSNAPTEIKKDPSSK